jgi:hypothetical protein
MSNFQDSISADELKALYAKATEKKQMTENAPWKGTEESVGNPELGIIQQAIDAVDDNCNFSIKEFLKGAHYSIYLYLRNIETELAKAVEDESTADIIYLSARLGEIRGIYNSLGETFSDDSEDDNED